ncbi:MAG TPA: S26 family signal peptidase [Patescibacteria group bacterium]|nr:S26 family signal peptidase [Patescibacteria group bacterium]
MRRMRGPLGPLVACLAIAVLVRRSVDVVQVRGRSMIPTLRPGDRLLVVRSRRPARVGEVVLALDPRDAGRELVKRVAAVGPDGVTLHGDNPAFSTDGRAFGPLPATAIRWRVLARWWPIGRAGRLPARPAIPPFEA